MLCMELTYDPIWDESGELRRGCTVREALAWLTRFGGRTAGEPVTVNGAVYKDRPPALRASSEEIPLNFVPAEGENSVRSIPSSSPHKICDFAGSPESDVADKPIAFVCDGYYHQLNFSV